MLISKLMRGVSAGALLVVVSTSFAQSQEALPSIDVGAARTTPTRAGEESGRNRPAAAASQIAAPQSAIDPGGPKDPTAYHIGATSTATRTDTPIMQTPVQVQIVPRQVITDQQAITIDAATRNVSGVFSAPYVGFQGGWLIRGYLDYAYYQDGVRVNPWAALPPRDTVDVQQLEIVKGPASILYGRMQPGGLVEVTTKMPQAEERYEVEQQFASYSGYRTTFSATGPLNRDKSLLYRFDGAFQTENSFIDGVHNRHVYLAPKLLFQPAADTSLLVYLQFYGGRDGMNAGLPGIYSPDAPKAFNSVAAVPRSRNYASPDAALETKSDFRIGYRLTHEFDQNWKVTHRFEINLRDFQEPWVDVYNPDPASCSPANCPVFRDTARFFGKEQNYFTSLEATGHFDTFGLGHTLLIGADGYRANDDDPYLANYSLAPAVNLFAPGYPTNLVQLNSSPDSVSRYVNTESWYGIYLQDQIKLPYNIQLLAGFRYDSARVTAGYKSYYPSWSETQSNAASDAVKPRVGLLWQPIPQLSLYGNYIEGFGVSNGVDAAGKSLPPEEARQWEGGAKLSLFDDRLTATGSWFHIVKTNVLSPVPGGIGAATGVSEATGAVRNTGVEFDLQGQLTPEVKFIGSYASIDTKIITDINGARAGNHWWGVPRNSGSFWAVYEPQFELLRGFAIGAGFVARGSVEVDKNNSFTLPGYTTVDLMSRYSFDYDTKKVTLQFNVSNMLDQTYYTSSGWTGGFIAGAPRSFRGSMKIAF